MTSLKLTNAKFESLVVDLKTIKKVKKASGGRAQIWFYNESHEPVVVEEAYQYVLAEVENCLQPTDEYSTMRTEELKMAKQKKMEVLRFSLEGKTPDETAKRVEEVIKSLNEYGFEKIDIKLSVKTFQDVEPWDLV